MSTSEIIVRLKSHWALKILLGLGLIVMFAVFYLLPQRCPIFPGTAMKPLWIDRMIPFVPNYVYLYESLYLLMPIAPWLMTSKKDLTRYSKGLILMSVVGFCFFFFYPTLSPRPQDIHNANLLYRRLVQIDNEFNAFPSLHVAYAVFHSACCYALFRSGATHKLLPWTFWVWTLGIALSTLLTKQHVLLDVLAGAALGLGSYGICFQPDRMPWARRRQT